MMQVTVKLVGPFGRFLPTGSAGNETGVDIEDGTTVSGLMQQMKLPADLKCMVSINDEIVPIGERQSRLLSASDYIKIIPPLKGG